MKTISGLADSPWFASIVWVLQFRTLQFCQGFDFFALGRANSAFVNTFFIIIINQPWFVYPYYVISVTGWCSLQHWCILFDILLLDLIWTINHYFFVFNIHMFAADKQLFSHAVSGPDCSTNIPELCSPLSPEVQELHYPIQFLLIWVMTNLVWVSINYISLYCLWEGHFSSGSSDELVQYVSTSAIDLLFLRPHY